MEIGINIKKMQGKAKADKCIWCKKGHNHVVDRLKFLKDSCLSVDDENNNADLCK